MSRDSWKCLSKFSQEEPRAKKNEIKSIWAFRRIILVKTDPQTENGKKEETVFGKKRHDSKLCVTAKSNDSRYSYYATYSKEAKHWQKIGWCEL